MGAKGKQQIRLREEMLLALSAENSAHQNLERIQGGEKPVGAGGCFEQGSDLPRQKLPKAPQLNV